ncbi:MAG: fused MFS/spermidine synthase [Patescibacteria group bacterium]
MPLTSPKIVYLLFFFSGTAGLIYEIVWGRLLVLIFGSTTNSIVAVISAFLGGLAIGSLIAGQIADRLSGKKLIKTYSFLEIGIGLSAASTLILLETIKSTYALFSDGSSVTLTLLFIKFALTIFVLSIPTILMGATLPILVRFAESENQSLGKSVSLLYATNTIGGVVGVLISAFVLIELFGLSNSLLLAVAINLLIGAVAFFVSAKDSKVTIQKSPNLQITKVISTPKLIVLGAFFMSGLISIAYEVLWSRIFTPTIGTLIYAFATVLAIYILGIGIGSLIYQKFARIIKGKNLAFAICEAGIGIAAIASVILTHKFVIDNGFRIAAIVLPATILMGLTFPAVVALLSNNKHTGKIVGAAYFANTAGSITGGFLASFLFIPTFGSSPSIIILAIFNLAIAIYFILREREVTSFLKYLSATFVLIPLLAGLWLLTAKGNRLTQYTTDLQILTAKLNNINYTFAEDEVASIFAFVDPKNNDQGLFIDGVATTSRVSETRFMAHIPIALHPNPEKVLVIAFGMGTTFRSSLAQNLETDAIELVPTVPKLMHFFHPDAQEVLLSPKGKVIINDGRNYALLTDKTYDIVTIDPPPPFNAAGTTVLHSKEFYEDLTKILNPGGIVSQWIYYNGSRVDDISLAIKSFLDVFPYVLAYQKVGSVGGIFLQGSITTLDSQRINLMFEDEEAVKDLEEVIQVRPNSTLKEEVTIELVGDRQSLAKRFSQSLPVSDKHPRTEYFKLRHKFTDAPVLIGDSALAFIEQLKEDYQQSK